MKKTLSESILNELDSKNNTSNQSELYFNLFTEVAKAIESKYKVNDVASKLDISKLKIKKYNNYIYVTNKIEDYMKVPFLECPLNIYFEFSTYDSRFKVRALLSNPNSTSFWSDTMKGKTLASGKFVDNNITYYKDRN